MTFRDARDEPILEPGPGETPVWSYTQITGLFDSNSDPEVLRLQLESALGLNSPHALRFEVLEDRQWERTWLDHFQPMRFGQRLWVAPFDQEIPDPNAVTVRLDPGLAFGTGTHPTTALCLEWLQAAGLADQRVVDYGCGSGILSVAAAKLGAASVLALDHDPQAIEATVRNAERNHVSTCITSRQDIPDGFQPVDLIVANILANVLIELAPRLAALLCPMNGRMVLSGVLTEQADAVATAYEPFLHLEVSGEHDGWVRLTGTMGD